MQAVPGPATFLAQVRVGFAAQDAACAPPRGPLVRGGLICRFPSSREPLGAGLVPGGLVHCFVVGLGLLGSAVGGLVLSAAALHHLWPSASTWPAGGGRGGSVQGASSSQRLARKVATGPIARAQATRKVRPQKRHFCAEYSHHGNRREQEHANELQRAPLCCLQLLARAVVGLLFCANKRPQRVRSCTKKNPEITK